MLKVLHCVVEKSWDIIVCTKVGHLSHINDTPRWRLIQARYISKKTHSKSSARANNINLWNKVHLEKYSSRAIQRVTQAASSVWPLAALLDRRKNPQYPNIPVTYKAPYQTKQDI